MPRTVSRGLLSGSITLSRPLGEASLLRLDQLVDAKLLGPYLPTSVLRRIVVVTNCSSRERLQVIAHARSARRGRGMSRNNLYLDTTVISLTPHKRNTLYIHRIP